MSRKIILFSLTLGLLLLSCVRTEESQEGLVIEDEIVQLEAEHGLEYKNFEEISEGRNLKSSKSGQNTKLICTGGLNPNQMSRKKYLEVFAKGPCSPQIMLPGIMGSKLMVTFTDCEAFKTHDPDTFFKHCGWKNCIRGNEFAPLYEYRLWIPKPYTPMSLTSRFRQRSECFAGLLQPIYVKNEDGTYSIENKPGLQIRTLGETRETHKKSQSMCGFKAFEDLLPFQIQIRKYTHFKPLRVKFEEMGYVVGLTLQALPYDWRNYYGENNLKTKYKRAVDELYEATGKKVTLIAHSFGNLQTLDFLWKQTQSYKDKKIQRYIALAPPILGAPIMSRNAISLIEIYGVDVGIGQLGLDEVVMKKTGSDLPGLYSLMMRGTFGIYKGDKWMQDMLKRVKEEEGNRRITKGTIMDIFPSEEHCMDYFSTRPAKCSTGIYDMGTEFGTILGDQISYEKYEENLKKYSHSEKSVDLWKKIKGDRFDTIPNPGVQVNILYSSTVPTPSKFSYDFNPSQGVKEEKFQPPSKTEYQRGDGSVVVASAITPGIKWASEFNDGLVGQRAVNFIEMCSTYKRRKQVFSKQNKVEKNAYFGIECDCSGQVFSSSKGDACDHVGMMVDRGLVDFVQKSANDGQEGGKVGLKFRKMSEQKLRNYESSCEMFYRFHQH